MAQRKDRIATPTRRRVITAGAAITAGLAALSACLFAAAALAWSLHIFVKRD